MKNSSQTQHHRSETKRKEEKKIEQFLQDGMQGTVANGTVAAMGKMGLWFIVMLLGGALVVF